MRIQTNEVIDSKYGFERYKEPTERLGWLMNMHPVSTSVLFLKLTENRVEVQLIYSCLHVQYTHI